MARNRILVVEDDETISKVIVKNLISTGYTGTPFMTGRRRPNRFRLTRTMTLRCLTLCCPGLTALSLWHT